MPDGTTSIQTFKVLCDLEETKSFSRAAFKNHITQSAVSQQLSLMERSLKLKLIDRRKGWFAVTPDGARFFEGARAVLKAHQELLDGLLKNEQDISGVVRLHTIYSIGLYGINRCIRSFLEKYPKVKVEIRYYRFDQIYENLQSGECDIGIVAYPTIKKSLVVRDLKSEEPMVVVVSPNHRLADKPMISLRDIRREKFITYEKDIPTRRFIDDLNKKHRLNLNFQYEFDNMELIKRSVEIGHGISMLPKHTVEVERRAGSLNICEIKEGPFYRRIALIHRREANFSLGQRTFVNWIQDLSHCPNPL